MPISLDKIITDDDVKTCINPRQIYCIDIIADNEQYKLTDSYTGKTLIVESDRTHMKIHRELVHDKEFTVNIVFSK